MTKVNQTTLTTKPWDAKLAHWLVRPLKNSWISPNHLTTVRLVTGLVAAGALAVGRTSLGAWLFVLSNFLDHTDGELARISGKSSQWGHWYDLASDAVIHILLFLGMGYSLMNSQLGIWALLMGLLCGLSVACIFHLRNEMEQWFGKEATHQPHAAGFDVEDVLYLFPVVALFPSLAPVLIVSTIGASAFAVWIIWQYRSQFPLKPQEPHVSPDRGA